jgi:hypothetical protein
VIKNRGLQAMECRERNAKKIEKITKSGESHHFFLLAGAGFAAAGFAAAGSFWMAAGCSDRGARRIVTPKWRVDWRREHSEVCDS